MSFLVTSIVGARPQFVKAAVVSAALAKRGVEEQLVHTGQHYDRRLSDVFFEELGIPAPAAHLGIGGLSHGAMTGRMLERIEEGLLSRRPNVVLVYGDTDSTLAGALAAAKLGIPVAHVEAGLRSFNRAMPEEINRVVADHLSDRLYVPTANAAAQLEREGIAPSKTLVVGDVMFDATLRFRDIAEKKSDALARLGLERGNFVLATLHRAENTDDRTRLAAIVEALEVVAQDLPVVLPLHPRTKERLGRFSLAFTKVRVTEPLGYFDMLALENAAALVATDSGGVQKEAFFCRVPCVTFRTETEWTELVDSGWNRLAPPTDTHAIVAALRAARGSQGRPVEPYGSGDAADRIAEDIPKCVPLPT